MTFPTQKLPPDLCLRRPRPQDATALFNLVETNRVALEQWLDWPRRIHSPSDARRLIQEMRLFNEGGQKLFVFIFRRQVLAGSLALLRIDPTNRSAELGYWKSPAILSRGEILRAGQRLLAHCQNNLGLHRLEIRCAAANIPAVQLAQELGFQEEGRLREAWRYNDRYHDLVILGKLLK